MTELTNKRKGLVAREDVIYREDMMSLPRRTRTSQNVPFWNNHPASDLLEKDEKSGIAKSIIPANLWELRK